MRNLIRGLIAAVSLAALPLLSDAGVFVGVSVNIAPPVLPVYVQPACPAAGYIWIPGYWAWGGDEDGYYWVPGTWALAPSVGLLWTPGYWGWETGAYLWHGGYWGPHVGFYGGINYGYGYGGRGFEGGEWRGNQFYYNRSVTNVTNVTNITNVYNRTVVNNVTVNKVSFNGGSGGVAARPDQAQLAAAREHHIEATPLQREHQDKARGDTSLRAAVNGGHPPIAATAKPASFTGRGVVAARGATAAAAANRGERPAQPGRAATETHESRPAAARTDRPPSAQHGASENRAAGPRGERPPTAQRPAPQSSGEQRAATARPDRPAQAQRPAAAHPGGSAQPERAMHSQPRERPAMQPARPPASAPPREGAPQGAPHPQAHGPAPGAPHQSNPQGNPHEQRGPNPRPEGERQDHGRR